MTQQKICCMAGYRNMLWSLDVMAYQILADIYMYVVAIAAYYEKHRIQ